MFRESKCQEYRQRRKEQSARLKGGKKVKKKKHNERVVDCVEKEEKDELQNGAAEVGRRRCSKKKRKTARQRTGPSGRISLIDTLLKRIQPPIEDRELFLSGRHVACFLERAAGIDLSTIRRGVSNMSNVTESQMSCKL